MATRPARSVTTLTEPVSHTSARPAVAGQPTAQAAIARRT
jgi:hypothetical protein